MPDQARVVVAYRADCRWYAFSCPAELRNCLPGARLDSIFIDEALVARNGDGGRTSSFARVMLGFVDVAGYCLAVPSEAIDDRARLNRSGGYVFYA